MIDKVELLRKAALDEELTPEELEAVTGYIAEISEKMQLDPRAIEKHMWRGVPKADRRLAQPVRTEPKIGRNELCPCGCCGAKYKNCCGRGM